MNYRIFFYLILIFFINSCDNSINKATKEFILVPENTYRNNGFALIYNNNLENIKKLEDRSFNIYHKSLKKKSMVKILNPANGKYLIAEVKSNKVKFSPFYNSIVSLRIAEELELNFDEPYISISSISKDSTFVAKKSKMFEEERSVAEKAPVDGIQINDLNSKNIKKKITTGKKFSYLIKVADFYYKDTAIIMKDRIIKESTIKKVKINRMSKTKFRVLIGPFNDIKSLRSSFENLSIFNFENLEILKND